MNLFFKINKIIQYQKMIQNNIYKILMEFEKMFLTIYITKICNLH